MRAASLLVLVLSVAALFAESIQSHAAQASVSIAPISDRSVERLAAAGSFMPQAWTGIATFYGAGFQGQPMADGILFDMNNVHVAASNTWPLGTMLRVERVPGSPWDATLSADERETYFQRSIVVKVEDHGAFHHALDLSQAAFAQLGRTDEGVIHVRIETLNAVPSQTNR